MYLEHVFSLQRKHPVSKLSTIVLLLSMVGLSGCSLAPRVIAPETALEQANEDVALLSLEQELPQEPIDLYEAMARAVLYNRDRRLALMESALASRQSDLSRFDMLPSLAANAGYIGRDSYNASSSVSLETGQESLEPSYSTEKNQFLSDVSFTWNMLDFGLSYVRANQASDRHLIALEKERKAIHLLLRDIRRAWWEAVSAQRMTSRLDDLSEKVRKVLDESRQMERSQLQNPLDALAYQRSLMQILRGLQTLRRDLSGASYNLAALMGLPPGVEFTVEDPGVLPSVVEPEWQTATLEKAALTLRSELMQSRYEDRIASQEVRAALLGLLPHLNLDLGWNMDSNTYLANNNWWDWGANIGLNLFNIFKAPYAMQAAQSKEEVAEQRRLALSMTVLMQVHLARVNHITAMQAYKLDDQYLNVQQRIMKQTLHTASSLQGKSVIIREELDLLLAEVRRDKSYADLQDSYGRVLVTVGIDPIEQVGQGVGVAELAENIRDNIESWNQQKIESLLANID